LRQADFRYLPRKSGGRIPITTFASVEAFTFFPFRIARIVLRSIPVSLVVFRNPRADFDQKEKALRIVSKQLLALEEIVRETKEEGNTDFGFEQLKRWKDMTAQLIEEIVSKSEASSLRNKSMEPLSWASLCAIF
jgi:hypothetical protein